MLIAVVAVGYGMCDGDVLVESWRHSRDYGY
jgi:hypothetical protein